MAKYSDKNRSSEKTKDDAMKIARGIQKPGQVKEQTKLIALGIKKGIEQYKKKESAKARELDKKIKKANASTLENKLSIVDNPVPVVAKSNILPWLLLLFSWVLFAAYVVLIK